MVADSSRGFEVNSEVATAGAVDFGAMVFVFATGGTAKPQRIVLRFDAFAARLVGERTWHPTQQIRALTGGEIELTMQLSGLEEIERWVLSWGGHARVVAPKALREKVRAAAREILRD